MENKEIYNEVKFTDIHHYCEVRYSDGDIVLVDNFRQLPELLPTNVHFDFFLVVICLKGKMQVKLQSKQQVFHPYDILCCKPNILVSNCMISPDFDGKILCLSSRILQNFFYADKTIWKNYFYLSQLPIINIGEERAQLFESYYQLLNYRIKQPSKMYNKEAMSALINAAMYDLLTVLVERSTLLQESNQLTQGDILFKKFLDMLTEEQVHERSVVHYAERLCVTPKYLSTVIKRASGKTAFEWISQFVIEDIVQQLKYSNRTIKEIAEFLKFENLSFFGKYVRQHLGCSPTEYRKRLGLNLEK